MAAISRLHRPLALALGRIPRLQRLSASLMALFDSCQQLLRARHLVLGLGLALGAWSCEAWALHLILRPDHPELVWTDSFFAFGAATLLGVLSMLPGGLGGFEATMVLLLGSFGVGRSDALAATVLIRIATLWFATGVGAVFLGLWFLLGRRGEATSQPR